MLLVDGIHSTFHFYEMYVKYVATGEQSNELQAVFA